MNTTTLVILAALVGVGLYGAKAGWFANLGIGTQPVSSGGTQPSPTPVSDTSGHATSNDVWNNVVTQAGTAVGDLINGIFGS